MYLYHYYDKRSGPFKSLTALTPDEADSVLEKIKLDRPSSLTSQRDSDYISKRMNCERIVRKEALYTRRDTGYHRPIWPAAGME